MQSQDNGIFDDLVKNTVAIQRSEDGRVLGTGVIVTNDGLIVTWNIRTTTLDYKNVDVYFLSNPNARGHADVLEEYSDASSDIAFLQPKGRLLDQATVASNSAHTIRSFRSRNEKAFDGLYSDGIIQGKVHNKIKEDNDTSLQESNQLDSDSIDHGMSWAAVFDTAVFDTRIDRVIFKKFKAIGTRQLYT